jgi:hypothetical protein
VLIGKVETLAIPQGTFGDSDYGRITSTILTPREIQRGLKLTF